MPISRWEITRGKFVNSSFCFSISLSSQIHKNLRFFISVIFLFSYQIEFFIFSKNGETVCFELCPRASNFSLFLLFVFWRFFTETGRVERERCERGDWPDCGEDNHGALESWDQVMEEISESSYSRYFLNTAA